MQEKYRVKRMCCKFILDLLNLLLFFHSLGDKNSYGANKKITNNTKENFHISGFFFVIASRQKGRESKNCIGNSFKAISSTLL